MQDVVKFFWSRWRAAVQVDMANKLQAKPTHFWVTADEWVTAYKNSLSKNKQNEFDKEWNKLEAELDAWHNAPPKQQNAMKNPLL